MICLFRFDDRGYLLLLCRFPKLRPPFDSYFICEAVYNFDIIEVYDDLHIKSISNEDNEYI